MQVLILFAIYFVILLYYFIDPMSKYASFLLWIFYMVSVGAYAIYSRKHDIFWY